MKPFTLEEIRNSAMRVDSRFDLGDYVMRGPKENIMELDSWLAWSSVAAKLHHEGYTMVPPREYAASYGITEQAILDRIEKDGSLFALMHETHDATFLLVPMAERDETAPPAE